MQSFKHYPDFETRWKDPGPRPEWRSGMNDEEYRAYNRSVMVWEARLIGFSLLHGRICQAYEDEAKRDAAVKRLGLDPQVCNRNMSRKV